jgi:hypothetical protein
MAKKRANKGQLPAKATVTNPTPEELLADLRSLIQTTRSGVARAVNSAQVLLYWQVGQRILTETLRHGRAGYGEEIVAGRMGEGADLWGPSGCVERAEIGGTVRGGSIRQSLRIA